MAIEQRREVAARELELPLQALSVLDYGGLQATKADKVVENVLGVFALPFAVGLNVTVNGKDFVAPMVVEEPSVVAAASNASKMIRAGGGFHAEADPPLMISQVQLDEVPDFAAALERITAEQDALVALGNQAVPGLVRRGGGVRSLRVRDLGEGMLVVHLHVDCRDAMGANLVNTVAEAVAERLVELAGGSLGLRILSNLCDERKVRVTCRVPAEALAGGGFSGEQVRDGVVRASRFAERDPYRAATHNKGLMNGLDAVVLACGNDWRAVEAGAHAYAARSGVYSPLCTWCADGTDLLGDLTIPLALGTVGGPTRVHEAVQLALQMVGAESAAELAMVAASVGMASNLAALRALATEGIQQGHMALHARSVAIAAGAQGDEVERVAGLIHQLGDITLARATEQLHALRSDKST